MNLFKKLKEGIYVTADAQDAVSGSTITNCWKTTPRKYCIEKDNKNHTNCQITEANGAIIQDCLQFKKVMLVIYVTWLH